MLLVEGDRGARLPHARAGDLGDLHRPGLPVRERVEHGHAELRAGRAGVACVEADGRHVTGSTHTAGLVAELPDGQRERHGVPDRVAAGRVVAGDRGRRRPARLQAGVPASNAPPERRKYGLVVVRGREDLGRRRAGSVVFTVAAPADADAIPSTARAAPRRGARGTNLRTGVTSNIGGASCRSLGEASSRNHVVAPVWRPGYPRSGGHDRRPSPEQVMHHYQKAPTTGAICKAAQGIPWSGRSGAQVSVLPGTPYRHERLDERWVMRSVAPSIEVRSPAIRPPRSSVRTAAPTPASSTPTTSRR